MTKNRSTGGTEASSTRSGLNQNGHCVRSKNAPSTGYFKTDFSLLVWQAQVDGFEFAANNTPQFAVSDNIPTDISASLSTVDFAWAPAFKVLFGYQFAHPSWAFNTRWTWYYSRSNRSMNAPLSDTGGGLLPLWIPPQAAITTFPTYGSAKGTLLLQLNNFDIELAYTADISRALFLKLHGGLKAIVMTQVFRAKYTDGSSDGINQMINSNAHAKNVCRGLGPRIGFGSKWLFPHGWSLIAEATGAWALSDIETKRKDHSLGTSSGIPQNISIHFREAFWVWRPLLEGKAGAQWQYCFGSKKNKIFDVEFAYEIQEYWEQNMLTRYADSAIFYVLYNNRGNLTLQGFSLTFALGY